MSRGYYGIALFNPKTNWNIGGAMRALQAFDGDFGIVVGNRFKTFATDTGHASSHIPIFTTRENLFDSIPYNCVPVAVELTENARDIRTFTHPERACYIFGPEDGSVRTDIIERCPHIIKIPTKICLNLAMAVNVTLYDRIRSREC